MINIFFCHKASQLSAASKIMDTLPSEDKNIVVLLWAKDTQYHRIALYKKRICRKHCNILILRFSFLSLLATWLKLLYLTKLNKVITFTCSWDIAEFRILHVLLRTKEARTFDDGAFNLILTDEFLTEKAPNSIRVKLLHKLSRWTPQYLMKNSEVHYTYFPEFPHYAKSVKAISFLGEYQKKAIHPDLPTIKLFIGQPVHEFAYIEDCVTYVERILKDYGVDYYFPHPREPFELSDKSKTVQTLLLFEDYFAENFSGKNIIIYSFFSTTLLSLYKQPNVTAISLLPKHLKQEPRWLNSYKVVEKLGIQVIQLDY